MNSQSWLTTYLTQKSLKILLLKCLKSLESCLFRQRSEFLSVGQCPSWATSWNVRVWSLQDAPLGSWGYKRTKGNNWTPGVWRLHILAPNPHFPIGFLQVQKLNTVVHHIQTHFPQNCPTHPGHPLRSNPPLWLPLGRIGSFWQNLWHRFCVLLS